MKRPLSPADLWKLARIGAPAPAPGGGFAVAGVTRYDADKNEGREVLHLFAPGAAARALTSPDASSGQPAVSRDGRSLAFVRKPPGKDQGQLHVMPLDGGEARALTDLPLGVTSPVWTPDGRIVVLVPLLAEALTPEGTRRLLEERAKQKARPRVTEARVYRFWDHWLTDREVLHVFLVDPAGGELRDLTPDSRLWFDLMDPDGQLDVAPDGSEVVFSATAEPEPQDLLRAALHAVGTAPGSEVRCLTPANPADDVRPRYTPDGRAIVFGTKRDLLNYADRVRLARLDRATLAQEVLTEAWDMSASTWELVDASTAVVEVEERGRSCLYRVAVDAAGRAPELVIGDGSWHSPRPAGDCFVYAQHSSHSMPPAVARVPLGGGGGERLGGVNDELLAEVNLPDVEELWIPGAGGREIQVWLARPRGRTEGRLPLLQVIHGGPYGAHHDGWHFRWNVPALLAPGYAGAFVNFHGSSGFGQEFSDAILTDWGGRAAADILAATDYLVEKGVADPTRMAILGGSFGGYMTAWLATQTDRFACAIAHAAVYEFPGMLAGDVTQGLDREMGAEPWSQPHGREQMLRWDPAAWAATYRTPTLVIHGARDYRVPVQQGMALYGTLKAKGVPARLVVYEDENHWIMKPQNSLNWYAEVHAWLARWLRP